jgi:hypothetical protein
MPMFMECWYQSALAFFQAVPHRGVPGGSRRWAIGRPLNMLALMPAPPRKPSPAWSKLSLLN